MGVCARARESVSASAALAQVTLAPKAMPLNGKHCFWKLRGSLSLRPVSCCLFLDRLFPYSFFFCLFFL